jgi:hypothetical protein
MFLSCLSHANVQFHIDWLVECFSALSGLPPDTACFPFAHAARQHREQAQQSQRLDGSSFMRSSKSRSRGNKNRNTNRPTGGSIINRVFDSSGPEGKVRGTPQQIIEKYNQLHRDAQLSNDRVNAENHAQHAEHYLRMLAEAQREVDRQREEQEEQNRARQADRDRERAEQEELNRQRQSERDRERNERLRAQEDASNGDVNTHPEVSDDSGLVETAEGQPREQAAHAAAAADPDAEAPAVRARKPRAPRKPRVKPEANSDAPAAPDTDSTE